MVHFRLEFSFHLFGKKRQTETQGTDFINEKIAEREEQGRYKTADNYRTCLRSFSRFMDSDAWTLEQWTKETIQGYAGWLQASGVCQNTSAFYLRTLRGLYYMAVRERGMADRRPFDGQFLGKAETGKRCVGEEDICRLRLLDLSREPQLAFSRDLFLFSIYAMGMPFIDIAYMRHEQIADGTLYYRRHKTDKRVSVSIEPPLQAIIDRYSTPDSPFVFPILTPCDSAQTLYRDYRNRLRTHNASLSRLSRMLGVRLTSYVPRHTWATLAYREGVDLQLISQALGHSKPSTTLLYIKTHLDPRLAEANRAVIGKLT